MFWVKVSYSTEDFGIILDTFQVGQSLNLTVRT